jgi:hypothetical protein
MTTDKTSDAEPLGLRLSEGLGPNAPEVTKADRVHALANAGPYPGMSEAFDAHMGAACWTDPAYAPDASMWAASWKASAAFAYARGAVVAEQVESLRAELARLDAAAKHLYTDDWVDDDVRVRDPRA